MSILFGVYDSVVLGRIVLELERRDKGVIFMFILYWVEFYDEN